MASGPHPYIDIAVIDMVRDRLSAGDAVLIISEDLDSVVFANGAGARLAGFDNPVELTGSDPELGINAKRQLRALDFSTLTGRSATIALRILSGVNSAMQMVSVTRLGLPGSESALMLSAAADGGIANAIEGLASEGSHAAILDADGSILFASKAFETLAIGQEELAHLAGDAASERDRMIKRRIRAGNLSYPAGIGRISDAPGRFILLVIEDAAGQEAPEAPAEAAPIFGKRIGAASQMPAAMDRWYFHGDRFSGSFTSPESGRQRPGEAAETVTGMPVPANAPSPATANAPLPRESETLPGTGGPLPAAPRMTVDAEAVPVRFTWKIDAAGFFSMISPEFSEAVGKNAADVEGRTFAEVAQVFAMDASGEIRDLLERHDTWSGRSVLWPIEGTDLRAPVDLAALPVYDRDRRFEGFRGFGIVRLADAVLDPESIGLALSRKPETASPAGAGIDETAEDAGVPEIMDGLPAVGAEVSADLTVAPTADDDAADHDPWQGEVPALEFSAGKPRAPADDKVIRLEERRQTRSHEQTGDNGLSPVERSAFREIAERLRREGLISGRAEAAPDREQTPIEAGPSQESPLDEDFELKAGAHIASPPDPDLEEKGEAAIADAGSPLAEPSDFQGIADIDDDAAPEPDEYLHDHDIASADVGFASFDGPAPEQAEVADFHRAVDNDFLHADADVSDSVVLPEIGHDTGGSADESVRAEYPREGEDAAGIAGMEFADGGAALDEEAEADEVAELAILDIAPGEDIPALFDSDVESAGGDDGQSAQEPDANDALATAVISFDEAPILSRLPVPILVHNGAEPLFANQAFFDLTGYVSLDGFRKAGGLDRLFVHAEDRPTDASHLNSMLRTAYDETVPVRAHLHSVPWKSGHALLLSMRPIDAGSAGLQDTDGDGAQVAALRQEVSELSSVLETATDGVVFVNPDGTIRSITQSGEALFGFDPAEVKGKPFTNLFATESQRAVSDYLSNLSGTGVASLMNDGREVIGREAHGRFIPLFMTIGRLSGSTGYCAVMRDITQWKRAEEELNAARRAAEHASSQKSEFLARVSHEIRTPLNAIIGFSDLMSEERFGPVGNLRYLDYLKDINRSGRHVLDLVNDLLDISKIEAGQQEMDFEAVSLNESLAEAVSMLQPQANRNRVIIRSSFASDLPEVVADLRSIKQIALNLLSNAVRYTAAGGQVIVSTAYELTGGVVIRVRDTGIGMTAQEIEQAMKPFKQINALNRGRGEGTGLGLPLTKAMVEANRANFAISSTPGQGTLVEVTFPSTRVLAD